jgi:hypothetical protein
MKDKLVSKTHFPLIVGVTSMLIALCAAAFSIWGVALLFQGAMLSVAIMASSLEFGKIISTVYLYRYWSQMGAMLKSYLIGAVAVLMVITSLGIFGFLSAAYKKSSLEYSLSQSKIQMVESQKSIHYDAITNAMTRITMLNGVRLSQEQRLTDAQTNSFLTRNPLQLQQLQAQTGEAISTANSEIKERNNEVRSERDAISKLDDQIASLKMSAADKKDIQTLQYVADQLNWELDRVAFWFIVAIIFVFDPLAIAMILAYNVAVFNKHDDIPRKELLLDSTADPKS